MRPSVRLYAWVAVIRSLSLIACDGGTGPSRGITVYEHPDFEGGSRTIDTNVRDLSELEGPCGTSQHWDNCISSIRITPGLRATVYMRRDFGLSDGNGSGPRTESLVVTSDMPDLEFVTGPCRGSWDDCISSIVVHVPLAE